MNSPEGILGQAFITDAESADALAKLARYEAHLQRSMFKALNELQHLQAARSRPESTTLARRLLHASSLRETETHPPATRAPN